VHGLHEHKKDTLSLGRPADAAAPYAPRAGSGTPPLVPPRDG
jgi:hypothetical protein